MSNSSNKTLLIITHRSGNRRPKRSLILAIVFAVSLVALLPAGMLKVAQAGDNQWTPLGPEGGLITAVVIDPSNSSILYAGAYGGGVFKSTNSGATWAGANSGLNLAYVTTLSIDPSNPNTVYCATQGGLFKSTNGGASWAVPFNGTANLTVPPGDIVVDPANSNIVYAAGGNNVHKSTNGGASWAMLSSGLSGTGAQTLALDTASSNILYVGFSNGGVFKSIDGGAMWNPVSSGLPSDTIFDLAIDSSNSNTMYAAQNAGLSKSTDGGANWKPLSGLPGSPTQVVLDPAGSNVLYAGTNNGLAKTTNGGTSWTSVNTGMPLVSIASMAIDPKNHDNVYVGTYGQGIFKSVNATANWTASNSGLNAFQITSFLLDPLSPNTLYSGTNGGGVLKSTDTGMTWTLVKTGFSGTQVTAMAMHPTNHTIYASANFVLNQSTDGGENWNQVTGGLPNVLAQTIVVDPVTTTTMYLGSYTGIFKTTDGGTSWAPAGASAAFGNRPVLALAIDPRNTQKICAGTYGGGAFRSSDGGTTWTVANAGFPFEEMTVNDLAVDAMGTLYAATGFRVFKSTDGAATWTAIANGFAPNASYVYCITIDPKTPTTLYAGTANNGVYTSTDAGGNWTPMSSGLSDFALSVSKVAVALSDSSLIYAGTNGAGVQQYKTDLSTPFISSATYDGAKTVTIQGRAFGQNPVVFINGVDKTVFMLSSSDGQIKLKTKAKKLGLQAGNNMIQVKTSNGTSSNVFTLTK
jgi:photosystem II stability/assembly factor-like uncharacterized protein